MRDVNNIMVDGDAIIAPKPVYSVLEEWHTCLLPDDLAQEVAGGVACRLPWLELEGGSEPLRLAGKEGLGVLAEGVAGEAAQISRELWPLLLFTSSCLPARML